jgi:hypothetical protein
MASSFEMVSILGTSNEIWIDENGDRTGHGICLWWLSRRGCLVVLVPSVSIEDRSL